MISPAFMSLFACIQKCKNSLRLYAFYQVWKYFIGGIVLEVQVHNSVLSSFSHPMFEIHDWAQVDFTASIAGSCSLTSFDEVNTHKIVLFYWNKLCGRLYMETNYRHSQHPTVMIGPSMLGDEAAFHRSYGLHGS